MLGNETLWDAATCCHEVLEASGISHVIVGEVAVCLHGYRRSTVDIELFVRRKDTEAIQISLNDAGCEWSAESHEFLSPSVSQVNFCWRVIEPATIPTFAFPIPASPLLPNTHRWRIRGRLRGTKCATPAEPRSWNNLFQHRHWQRLSSSRLLRFLAADEVFLGVQLDRDGCGCELCRWDIAAGRRFRRTSSLPFRP